MISDWVSKKSGNLYSKIQEDPHLKNKNHPMIQLKHSYQLTSVCHGLKMHSKRLSDCISSKCSVKKLNILEMVSVVSKKYCKGEVDGEVYINLILTLMKMVY